MKVPRTFGISLAAFALGAVCAIPVVVYGASPPESAAWSFDAVSASPRWTGFLSAARRTYWRPLDEKLMAERCRALLDGPVEARRGDPVDACIAASVASLDSHSQYYPPAELAAFTTGGGPFIAIGIEFAAKEAGSPIVVVAPIANAPAERAGVRPRDLITEIDGVDVAPLSGEQVTRLLTGEKGSTIRLKLLRAGNPPPVELSMQREEVRPETVHARLIDADLAYVRIRSFNFRTTQDVAKRLDALTSARGLILDLRSNPGGVLDAIVEIAAAFGAADAPVVALHWRDRQTLMSGKDVGSSLRLSRGARDWARSVPLVVLVNAKTASGSEALAQFLREQRARVVGTKTFGLAYVKTLTRIDKDTAVALVSAEMRSPNGIGWTATGLTPDIEVPGSSDVPWSDEDDAQLRRAVLALRER